MLLVLAQLALAYDPSLPPVQVGDAVDLQVDGQLDEPAWMTVQPVSEFRRHDPSQSDESPPCEVTEVRFLQDDRNLYAGIRAAGCDYAIRARLAPREKIREDDQVGIYLDPVGDGRSGYIFYINPRGVQEDIRNANGDWIFSWDIPYYTGGRLTEDGFEIEVAWPWRSLKYPSGSETQTWGVIVTRKTPHNGSKYSSPQVERRHPRLLTLAAPLQGVRPAGRGSGIELIPGLTGGVAWPQTETAEGPLEQALEVVRPSLDMRLGLTPDVSLAASVNPDFSQIEADVADVRVNPRFAFRYRERRPFFMDGIEHYEDRADTLYTRSINEPIYGVKLSGQERSLGVGLLHAIDRSPVATFNAAGTPGFDEADVAGRQAINTVMRTRLNAFGDGYVGLTLADKRLIGEPLDPAASAGPGQQEVAGLDLEIPTGGRWVLGGSTQQTWVGVQDQDLSWGMANEVSIRRAPGIGTGFELQVLDRTPGHRLETGFSPLSGATVIESELDHVFAGEGFFDIVRPGAETELTVERDGDRLLRGGPTLRTRVADVHQFEFEGGPIDQVEEGVRVQGYWARAEYDANPSAWLSLEPSVLVGRFIDYELLVPGDALEVGLETSLVPLSSVRLDTNASWARFEPEVAGPDGLPQFGRTVRQRITWQFTKALGLRVIEQYEDTTGDEPELASSVLLSWLQVPGTAAYLGFSDVSGLGGTGMIERTVFGKVTVLLRP